MTQPQIRTLRADEIDVRVGTAKPDGKGASFLLYKDARCDMAIMDETFGAMNWKREHSRDNQNCTVSVWDDEKKQWVGKEDTGTESNTEREKGLASDSFKRACVNWGIGRELYTAPFIWLNGNPNDLKYEKLSVKHIAYNDSREISELVLTDKKGNVVYTYGTKAYGNAAPKPAAQPTAQSGSVLTPQAKVKKFLSENQKAFEYYQQQYSHNATIDDFSFIELTEIYNHLKSNNKL